MLTKSDLQMCCKSQHDNELAEKQDRGMLDQEDKQYKMNFPPGNKSPSHMVQEVVYHSHIRTQRDMTHTWEAETKE